MPEQKAGRFELAAKPSLAAVSVLCCAILTAAAKDRINPERLQQHVAALTANSHRLAGSASSQQAAEYIYHALADLGVSNLVRLPVQVWDSDVLECFLELDGIRLPLLPMRANLVCQPVTPAEGVSGRLLYAGRGRYADFGSAAVSGAIVLLDYNAPGGWQRAFGLGARAVVFLDDGSTPQPAIHHVNVPANYPRFYAEEPVAALLRNRAADAPTVRVSCAVQWRAAETHSVLAYLPGVGAAGAQFGEEVLALAAPLDTYGDVPTRAPGARQAANAAGLLELARLALQNENRRPLLLAFFEGEGAAHAGARTLYLALHEKADAWKEIPRAEDSLVFLQEQSALAVDSDPLSKASGAHRRALLLRLRDIARNAANDLTEEIRDIRLALHVDPAPAQADLFSASLEQLTKRKQAWNDLRRLLDREQTGPAESPCLQAARETLIRSNEAAIADLERHLRALRARQTVWQWIGKGRIVLHVSLNLGDARTRWSLCHGGDSPYGRLAADEPGAYGKVFSAIEQVAQREPTRWPSFDAFPLRSLHPGSAITGGPFVTSGDVASMYGVFNLSVMTLADGRFRDGHPCDTRQRLDLATLSQSLDEACALLLALAGSEELSLRQRLQQDVHYAGVSYDRGQAVGPRLVRRSLGQTGLGYVPAGAMVAVRPAFPQEFKQPQLPYHNADPLLVAGEGGFFEIGPLNGRSYYVHDYYAARFNARGAVIQSGDQRTSRAQRGLLARQINLVDVVPAAVLAPPGHSLTPLTTPLLLDAQTESVPPEEQWRGDSWQEHLFAFLPRRTRTFKVFQRDGLVLLGMTDDGTKGRGIVLDRLSGLDLVAQSCADLWQLNEQRLHVLRDKRVTNDSLEWLHGEALDLLEQSAEAGTTAAAAALQHWSRWVSRRVYQPLLNDSNDLVRAVVILLFLAIPFAFALERLLFGSPHIYQQVAAFGVLFLLTFLLLYVSHPAFQIATSPIVVFLAFVIVLLSSTVLTIILRRFRSEMKAFQGLEQTVHSADVSRTGTLLAAVQMGISSMRRRPLRTLLTAVTVLLLTFSILTFASFGYTIGVVRTLLGPASERPAVLVHDPLWQALPTGVEEVFAGRFANRAVVVPRYWWTAEPKEQRKYLITNEAATRWAPLGAIAGIDMREFALFPGLAAALGDPAPTAGETPWIVLPTSICKELGVRTGDPVFWLGTRFLVAGVVDTARMGALANIDGSSLLPIDYREQQGRAGMEQLQRHAKNVDPSQLVPTGADSVAFVDAALADALAGELRALVLYPHTPDETAAIADAVATICEFPVYAADTTGTWRHLFAVRLSASGWQSLIFPLLLGGLIVLGTMLGSVADRQREIYTFSAMGLAPRHVAGLFFAEAALYAIIGGQGGYLLSQLVTRVLGLLADRGLLRVPELNYSSTNAIIAILIVMATVLISTIYPARRAARGANPGIARLWRIPPPAGDFHDLVFPFTVSQYDLIGIASFLKEHLDTYRDSSFGSFMAVDTRLVLAPESGQLGLEAHVSLAPFDLGITQTFEMRCTPSEIPGIDQVRLIFRRLSGTSGDWQRSNRRFIEDLRQQFLIWRTLAPATAELYRTRTLVAFPQLAEETNAGNAQEGAAG